jgi:hypothetical protein
MFKSVPLLRTTLATFSTILPFPPAVDRLVVIFGPRMQQGLGKAALKNHQKYPRMINDWNDYLVRILQQDLLLRILLLSFLFRLQVLHHMQPPP